jgi:enamine deaminase RidA (YjgF/YER057c/UK114 family)
MDAVYKFLASLKLAVLTISGLAASLAFATWFESTYGTKAAQACGLMILAQLKAALGSLSRVERVVKLGAFVSSTADFTDQPKVANGASELMAAVFGEAGRHARSAVGVPVLPLGAAVEVDAIVAIRD